MMPLKSERTLHIEAFEKIVPFYQETRYNSGGLSAMNYGKNDSGAATNTACSAVVRPSKSDFICDVEISAKRVLDADELSYFLRNYRDGYRQLEDVPAEDAELDLAVREKLGRRFRDVRLTPVAGYFAPKDVRGLRG
jgi:hypothetical protein